MEPVPPVRLYPHSVKCLLPPAPSHCKKHTKKTYYFTFIEVPTVQQDGITLSLTGLRQVLLYFSMKFLRGQMDSFNTKKKDKKEKDKVSSRTAKQ